MKTKMKYEIKNNLQYLYMTLLISFLTILPQFVVTESIKRLIADILLFIFLVAISKYSKTIFSIFILYLNLINIILINLKIHWASNFSALQSRISLSALSSPRESMEYLQTYVDYRDYIFIFYIFIIVYLLYRFVIHYKNDYKILKKIAFFISIILILILGKKLPINFIEIFVDKPKMEKVLDERKSYLNLREKQTLITNSKNMKYDKVIIILGESVNKHHMGIYGYNKDTTPFLDNLAKQNKLYKFNAIAPANQTRYAVPMLFTDANVALWQENYTNSQSIVSDFHDYGYKTYWISSQAEKGMWNSYVSSIGDEADLSIFFSLEGKKKTDLVITEYLENKKYNAGKEMYVLHLIGSHFAYEKRVSKEHILYNYPKNIVEKYDNTIFFTDNVIKKIFKYFLKNNQKILIVYVADHGELLSPTLQGHGLLPTYKDEYEVPLLMYSNIENSRLDELTEKNKQHYFNNENLNYIIKYVASISDNVHVSYGSNIFAIDPKNIMNYEKLNYFKQEHEHFEKSLQTIKRDN